MSSVIDVLGLKKEFTFPVKKEGVSWIKNLLHPDKKTVHAVEGVSFSIPRGQILAFIGPNGAGKSTTIKMLTGILYPSEGDISVLGLSPIDDRKELAMKIGTVFGQRSQLLYNLPLTDSFTLFGTMYELSKEEIQKRSQELIERFDLKAFMDQPIRKLSLGQRMRAEVAVALLHNPEIIFLDEPTIGLDIVAKKTLRETLKEWNKTKGTTIFLTSHDVGDIEALCERTIIINHGKIVVDMPTEDLRKTYFTEKRFTVSFSSKKEKAVLPFAKNLEVSDTLASFTVDTRAHNLGDVMKAINDVFSIEDLTVEETPLEDIIESIYGATK